MTAAELTGNQERALAALRNSGLHMIAQETEAAWRKGQSYYIDTRVNVKPTIRRYFNKGNEDAVAQAEAARKAQQDEYASPAFTKADFIGYLRERLIPDLIESGQDSTAADFKAAILFMEGAQKVHISLGDAKEV